MSRCRLLSPIVPGVVAGMLSAIASAGCPSEQAQEVALDSGGTAAMDYGACEPGAELPCTCADGFSGTQPCLASGLERGPCICGGTPPPPPTSDTEAPPGTESSGGSTGGTGTGSTSGSTGDETGPALDSSGTSSG